MGLMWTSAEGRPIGSRDGVLSGEATPTLRAPVGMPTVGEPQAFVKANQRQITCQGRTATHTVVKILKCGLFNVWPCKGEDM